MKQLFIKVALGLSLFAGALSSATAQVIPSDIGTGYFNGHIFPEHFSDVARTVPLSRNAQTLGPWYGRLGTNTFTVTFGQQSYLRAGGAGNIVGNGAFILPDAGAGSYLSMADIRTITGTQFPGMSHTGALLLGVKEEITPLWVNNGAALPNGCTITWSFDNNLDILDHLMTADIDAREELYFQFFDEYDNVLPVLDNVRILHVTEDNNTPNEHSPLVITPAEEIYINGSLNATTGRSVVNEVYAFVMKTTNVRKIIATQKGIISSNGGNQGYSLLLSKGAPDRGDAPASYGDASILSLEPKLKLGTIGGDSEKDPQYHATAAGDDVFNPGDSVVVSPTNIIRWNRTVDDEDGVAAIAPIANSGTGGEIIPSYSVAANITNNNGVDAYAIAWLDWNGNGVFDAGEAASTISIPTGSANVSRTFTWTNVELEGSNGRAGTFLRIRLSSKPMAATDATGFISDGIGEVEDYFVPFSQPLPIKLSSFDAYKHGNTIVLSWKTVQEYNSKGFEIERSADGINWIAIGFVESMSENGNSSMKLDYDFTDNVPFAGKNIYRLKQLDFDGKYEYSNTKMIIFDAESTIDIYPNPVKDNIMLSGLSGNESIRIYDAGGKMLVQLRAENAIMNIPFDKMTRGIYIIDIIGADGMVISKKIIKMD